MAIIDSFRLFGASVTAPAENAEPVTPSDTQDLGRMSRAIYLGAGGDIRVTMKGGQTVTLTAASAGWHPIRVSRIWASETTATQIVAFS